MGKKIRHLNPWGYHSDPGGLTSLPSEKSQMEHDIKQDARIKELEEAIGSGGTPSKECKCKYTGTATTNVGGIKSGDKFEGATMQEMWDAILRPSAPPTVSLNVTGGTFEAGSTNSVKVTATTTAGDKDIVAIKYYVNGNLAKEITNKVAGGGKFAYTVDNITATTEIKVVVTDGSNNVTQKVKYVVGPTAFYMASTSKTVPADSAAVRGMANSEICLNADSEFDVNINAGDKAVFIAVPANLPIKHIKHVENAYTEYFPVFSYNEVEVVDGSGVNTTTYRVYYYIPTAAYGASATYRISFK